MATESRLHPGLIEAMRMAADPAQGHKDPAELEGIPDQFINEMNATYLQFVANSEAEDARRKLTGDTEPSPAHVARQQELMARVIRRFSRWTDHSMDRNSFENTRKAAVARSIPDNRVDSPYVNTLLRGAEERAWKSCAACGDKRSNLRMCSRCKQARYCDVSCQTDHWNAHKKMCRSKLK